MTHAGPVAQQWGGQSPAPPRVPGKKIKNNNFPVTVTTRTSGYRTLECFIYIFIRTNCSHKTNKATHKITNFSLHPSLIALSQTLYIAVIRRREGTEGQERVEKGGRGARFGYLFSGPEFLVTPLPRPQASTCPLPLPDLRLLSKHAADNAHASVTDAACTVCGAGAL